ncbi:MAG TPA: DNA alkylation repair protein [Polyangiaceae bacterium]|nr:DNA alkylation repair protein [Polyangiaceae bacterium]
MAEPLKHSLNANVMQTLARDLSRVQPAFSEAVFVRQCLTGLEALELTARGWHIAEVLQRHLPADFPEAAAVVQAALGAELDRTDAFGMSLFRYLPYVFFVQKYGLDAFEPAMQLQYELTKRFSAESSIRAFLVRYPDQTLARLRRWTKDPNVHVRRLVSEGTRPRLPWAPRLRAFQNDPTPVLALLERLRDDGERYVQRSVANNLNDISKDHPELAVATCARWLEHPSAGRIWIARHALRSLVKQGHRGALRLFGAGREPEVRVERLRITPRRAHIGDTLRFEVGLVSTSAQSQALVCDYRVHFVKAGGKTSPKVFKLKQLELGPAESVELRGRVSLAPMTTRRHYPGRHVLELVVNGVSLPLGEFVLRPAHAD